MSDENNKAKNPEDWEYEYVELSEGSDLAGYEGYEYVELPADEKISLDSDFEIEEIEIEEIIIPDDIEVVEAIDDGGAFDYVIEIPYNDEDQVDILYEYVEEIIIPEDVKSINNGAPNQTIETPVTNPSPTNVRQDIKEVQTSDIFLAGDSKDNFIKISSAFFPANIEATSQASSILITVNPEDNYGWNIAFSNGLVMNIHDLQAYQCKNNDIPYGDGTIYCGTKKTDFKNIRRIFIYEIPEYASYNK